MHENSIARVEIAEWKKILEVCVNMFRKYYKQVIEI